MSLQMTRGAFRFITGNGAKKAYSLNTPTATLGIRGTSFDIAVGSRLGTGILVFDGSVRVCNRRNGECTVVNKGCGAVVASPNGELNSPRSAASKAALIKASFPLVSRQRSLRPNFRVIRTAAEALRSPPIPNRLTLDGRVSAVR